MWELFGFVAFGGFCFANFTDGFMACFLVLILDWFVLVLCLVVEGLLLDG